MAGSKYVDSTSIVQLIGCIMKEPSLLDDGKYFFNEQDFPLDFHKTIFGAIYNLRQMGAKNINIKAIEDYLANKPNSRAIYYAGNGPKWLLETIENADIENFDYYYDRIKKMSLLRGYDKCGMDISFIYDADNIFDLDKKQRQEAELDKKSLHEIADLIEDKISSIRGTHIDNSTNGAIHIGDHIEDVLAELQESPDMGVPLYGGLVNTVTRGARLGKFYLRSAATGVGKSRSMIADATYIAADQIYDSKKKEWIKNGLKHPVLYIATEQEYNEVVTMVLAFLADVPEDHILKSKYDFDEWDRINYAVKILKETPLYIEVIPDFNLRDIENIIKHNIRVNRTQFVFYDYIHTSMKILEEITHRSGGIKLREDNILFLLGVKLKEIATQFGVFILSSTQLNMDYQYSKTPDQNLLRGAKSLGDKADLGAILMDITEDDKESLAPIVSEIGCEMPNAKLSVYKNRRGEYNKLYIWIKANKGTCRFEPLFSTTYDYEIVYMEETKIIEVAEDEV